MSTPTEQLTAKALGVRGPRRELAIAVTGCFMGTVLLLAAVQFFSRCEHRSLQNANRPRNFFTVNKRVEGGALANLGKNDEGFSPEEITAIETRPRSTGSGRLQEKSLSRRNSHLACGKGRSWAKLPRQTSSLRPCPTNSSTPSRIRLGLGRKLHPCPAHNTKVLSRPVELWFCPHTR